MPVLLTAPLPFLKKQHHPFRSALLAHLQGEPFPPQALPPLGAALGHRVESSHLASGRHRRESWFRELLIDDLERIQKIAELL